MSDTTDDTSSLASKLPFWFRSTQVSWLTLSAPRVCLEVERTEPSPLSSLTICSRLPSALTVVISSVVRSISPSPSKSVSVVLESASSDCVVVDMFRSDPSPLRTCIVDVDAPVLATWIIRLSRTSMSPSPSRSRRISLERPSALTFSLMWERCEPSWFVVVMVSVRLPLAFVVILWVSTVSAAPSPSTSTPSARTDPSAVTVSLPLEITEPSMASWLTTNVWLPSSAVVRTSRTLNQPPPVASRSMISRVPSTLLVMTVRAVKTALAASAPCQWVSVSTRFPSALKTLSIVWIRSITPSPLSS
ncbi:hypothetical protein PsAD2_04093 [Pseudovibrio axinellae]|uniref:Uncharacterized protein n=1 Tax=Pseudovibrio axinellae TaxID=989403 RepID=A0A165U0Z5_9HYPH|nr:hypothetical protein PsAD2_04093 [Pseudovibrio axinellae]